MPPVEARVRALKEKLKTKVFGINVSNSVRLQTYLNAAHKLEESAARAETTGDLSWAYIYYLRLGTTLVALCKHNAYKNTEYRREKAWADRAFGNLEAACKRICAEFQARFEAADAASAATPTTPAPTAPAVGNPPLERGCVDVPPAPPATGVPAPGSANAVPSSLGDNSHLASGAPVAGVLVDGISAAERASALAALRHASTRNASPATSKQRGQAPKHLYGAVGAPAFWNSGVGASVGASNSGGGSVQNPNKRGKSAPVPPKKTKRFRVMKITGDGHCAFRSLAQGEQKGRLSPRGEAQRAAALRSLACTLLRLRAHDTIEEMGGRVRMSTIVHVCV